MEKESLPVPESFDWILSRQQRNDWNNSWNLSTPDGQWVMKAQLHRMHQWLEKPKSVYDAFRMPLDASAGLVFHTDKSSAQWYLTGLDKDTEIAYGMRFFKGQAMLGLVDMATILKETPLIFNGHVPGPLLADLQDLNITANQVEVVDRIPPIDDLLVSRKSALTEAFQSKGWVHDPVLDTFTHDEMKDVRITLIKRENDYGKIVDIGFALQTMEKPHLSSSTIIDDKSYIYDKMNFSASDMANEVHDKALYFHSKNGPVLFFDDLQKDTEQKNASNATTNISRPE